MDTGNKITKTTEQYAKHLLHRQRMQSMSPENRTRTLQRRITIINSLKNSYPPSLSNLLYTSNPFTKEFKSNGGSTTANVFHKSKDKIVDLSKEEEEEEVKVRRHETIKENDEVEEKEEAKRFSFGEYFNGRRDYKENERSNMNSEIFEGEFWNNNAKLEHKDTDNLFTARVLEIIEPDVVKVDRQSSTSNAYVTMANRGLSTTDSRLSANQIVKSSNEIYPDLVRENETLDNVMINNQLYESINEAQEKCSDETKERYYRRPTSPKRNDVATPNNDKQIDNLVYENQRDTRRKDGRESTKSTSYLKRNTSWFGKLMQRKPDLESTRKPDDIDNEAECSRTSTVYANIDSRSNTLNISEISEDKASLSQPTPLTKLLRTERLRRSNTLNRTYSMYKSFTQRIKNKFRGSVLRDTTKLPEQPLGLPTSDLVNPKHEKIIKDLLEKVEIQQTRIGQASKALELCSTIEEFVSSPERIESERILIIAQLQHKLYLDEIRRLMTSNDVIEHIYRESAEISISNMCIRLREEIIRRDYQSGKIVQWFVLVITEGTTVWSSKPVACPLNGQIMSFPGQLSIGDLMPNFKFRLTVYTMKTENTEVNHEDKYRITKTHTGKMETLRLACTSPKRFLRNTEKKMSPKKFEVTFTGIKESSLIPCGNLELSLYDLNFQTTWPLSGVPLNSVLQGNINLEIKFKLRLTGTHSGFLTHSDEIGGPSSWNRRWCLLEDRILQFWNYPREQEYKPPLYSIDLECCVSRKIAPVDRSLCPRARTLLVETMRKRENSNEIETERRTSCKVVKHLLSCDSIAEMIEWQTKLNHVVTVLREWNIIKL